MNLPLYTIAFWQLAWGLVFAGGMPVAILLRRCMRLPHFMLPLLMNIIFGLIGYGAFVSAVWWRPMQFLAVVACVSMAVAWWLVRNDKEVHDCIRADVITPMAMAMLATLLYSELFVVKLPPECNEVTATLLHNHIIPGMPVDAILQFLLNESLLAKAPLDQGATFLLGSSDGWGHGDRPPLLAGETLMATVLFETIGNRLLAYQLLGSVCQISFLYSVWATLRVIGVPVSKAATVLLLLVFTGFSFFHTSFLWSKLQAAAFAGGALALIETRRATIGTAVLIGICYALSMLSHGSVVFSLVPIFVYGLMTAGSKLNLGYRAFSLATALLLYLPWVVFQQTIAPPGDNLPKLFFAGVVDLNDGRSLVRAVQEAYASRTWIDIIFVRFQNLFGYIWPWRADYGPGLSGIRLASFFHLAPALGILCMPLVLWGSALFVANNKPLPFMPSIPSGIAERLRAQVWLFVAGTILWVGVAFAPGATVIHNGSLFNTAIPILLSSTLVAYTSARVQIQIAVYQAIIFFVVWIVPLPGLPYRYTPIALIVAAVSVLGLCKLVSRAYRAEWRERFDNELGMSTAANMFVEPVLPTGGQAAPRLRQPSVEHP